MLLLTGPPGSGKTHQILEQVRQALCSGCTDFRLLLPTATMAQHLQNQMAREGFVFRSALISTLYKFVEPWVAGAPQASGAVVELMVGEALERLSPSEFQSVADFPGFRASLARLIEELSSAGCGSSDLEAALSGLLWNTASSKAFQKVYADVETGLRLRCLGLRGERLRQAAGRIETQGLRGINNIFLDGFFSLAPPELGVIEALSHHADLTSTLPYLQASEAARDSLLAMGFSEKRCEPIRARPQIVVVRAPTQDQELGEIARRILEEAAAGRPFREMGIVVRTRDPYVPALQTTLERFGIPARFYFADPLADHSLVRYLTGAVDAMLGGWDHEQTLSVLRMTASGLGTSLAMDRFDFQVRERLPGCGLEGLREIAKARRLRALLSSLAHLEPLQDGRHTPAEWAGRVKALTRLFRPPRPTDPATHDMALLWRSQAAALEAFHAAIEETARILEPGRQISFVDFWKQAKTVLRLTSLRVPDHRRNVVHVLDVFEARQWELAVVFVCGLLEKQFPLYHPQDPIFPDDLRRLLQKTGLRLRTDAERQLEEKFLFELATTRATSTLVLSYPQFNEKGEENLRSFYLDHFMAAVPQRAEVEAQAVRPQPCRSPATPRRPIIYDDGLRERLREQHAVMTPTAIESFLQCPFQFFAGQTLRLQGPPPVPFERLDALVQGAIVHKTLADWLLEPEPLESLYERVFQAACEKERIPPSYRTEAVRLELLRNLAQFIKEPHLPGSWRTDVEQGFELKLDDNLTLRGRIDRIDLAGDGRALVIDYKYSPPERVHEGVKAHEDGRRIQGGAYMLAVEQRFGKEVAGMLFAGLRKRVTWDGWHIPLAGLERLGRSHKPEGLRELFEQAKQTILDVTREIREGRVAPCPADLKLCKHCDFRDICRVETAAGVRTAQGVEE